MTSLFIASVFLRNLYLSFVFFLPERDYLGRRIIFVRPGVSDPMCPTTGFDVLILMTVMFELVLETEEDQIRGVVYIGDAKGIRPQHFTIISPNFQFRVGKNTEVSWSIKKSQNRIVIKNFMTFF